MRFKVPPGVGVTATGGPYTAHVDGSTNRTVVTPVRAPWPLIRAIDVLPGVMLLMAPSVSELTDTLSSCTESNVQPTIWLFWPACPSEMPHALVLTRRVVPGGGTTLTPLKTQQEAALA